MEGASRSEENGLPEASSATTIIASSEDKNISTTLSSPLDNKASPLKDQDEASPSPVEEDSNHNHTSFGESKSSSALEVKSDNTEAKIVARPSTDDDYVPSVSSPVHRRCVSVDLVAKVPINYSNSGPSTPSTADPAKVSIDTAAPFESVKAAVSKFGGIVDWKAHRVHTVERRKCIEQELDKASEEMPVYKQKCQAANGAKSQVLKQLESTKRLIEELKLNLERAQTEEQQAKQDSELAKLRVEEMEQGIADESSFAAKAQLEVAKARHAAAVSELESVRDELEALRRDYGSLVAEKDAAEDKAEAALFTSRQVEKSVESLTIELITLKQSLDSAHSAHLEAEEHRLGAVEAKEQDNLNWEAELKEAEKELEKLNQQMITTKELKSDLAEATSLLHDLKAELAAYMESKPEDTTLLEEPETKTRAGIEAAINAAKKELVDVKLKIEQATKEVNILKVASASLKSQLEKENSQLQTIQEREGTASTTAASVKAELDKIQSEINTTRMKEKEEMEKLVELTTQLDKAAKEAEHAKALARTASDELRKAKDEAEQTKARISERERKLRTVKREIENAKASERLALAAISALHASESNTDDASSNKIALSIQEYYELSKRAHEAEEQANTRVASVICQIEKAKESEQKMLHKLEVASGELSRRKDALEAASQKVEQATQRKLSVEQELKKWKADHEQKRKTIESIISLIKNHRNAKNHDSSSLLQRENKETDAQEAKGGKKKKKPFFPKILMFLGKKKTHSSKGE